MSSKVYAPVGAFAVVLLGVVALFGPGRKQAQSFILSRARVGNSVVREIEEKHPDDGVDDIQSRVVNSQAANQNLPVDLNPFQQMENRRRKPCTL